MQRHQCSWVLPPGIRNGQPSALDDALTPREAREWHRECLLNEELRRPYDAAAVRLHDGSELRLSEDRSTAGVVLRRHAQRQLALVRAWLEAPEAEEEQRFVVGCMETVSLDMLRTLVQGVERGSHGCYSQLLVGKSEHLHPELNRRSTEQELVRVDGRGVRGQGIHGGARKARSDARHGA